MHGNVTQRGKEGDLISMLIFPWVVGSLLFLLLECARGSPITGLNRSDHTVRGEGEGKRRINIAELVALSSSGDYSKLAIIGVKVGVTNDRPFFASEKNVPSRVVVSGYDNKIGGNGR